MAKDDDELAEELIVKQEAMEVNDDVEELPDIV